MEKLQQVTHRALDAVRIALAEGVEVAFGTDLIGYMHDRQSGDFVLRMAAMSPVQALQSATFVGARLLRQEGQIGELVSGALADLLIVDGDPTRELSMLADPSRGIRLVMQGGRVVRSSL
jgi:imidazolonepropionase-like amidohydrolase